MNKFQVLTSHVWLRMAWNDNRIQWNPNDWNGIESLNIDANQLWLPDVVPYNGEQIRTNSITFPDNLPKVKIKLFVCFVKFLNFPYKIPGNHKLEWRCFVCSNSDPKNLLCSNYNQCTFGYL